MSLNKLSLNNCDFAGKQVLVRVDYNVPLNITYVENDDQKKFPIVEITNTQRIDATIPTISHIIAGGASRIVLISHMGRPNGKFEAKSSLKPVVGVLEKHLGCTVGFASQFTSESVNTAANNSDGKCKIVLLENLRFNNEEEGVDDKKNPVSDEKIKQFSAFLSGLGQIYVNDAFGACHRAHTSISKITISPRVTGFLMEKELEEFKKVLETPQKPLLSIIGGSKVSDKIRLIENLLTKVDAMIIAGGMSYTFRHVLNKMSIGSSLFDKNGPQIVPKIMEVAKANNVTIHLPIDYVVADDFSETANTKIVNYTDGIEDGWSGLDIGPESSILFDKIIKGAKTVVWNGPLGVFEMKPFENGTKEGLKSLIEATKTGTVSIIGGGDTATAAVKWGMVDDLNHVSTGGGAALELLEGKVLPGLVALSDRS